MSEEKPVGLIYGTTLLMWKAMKAPAKVFFLTSVIISIVTLSAMIPSIFGDAGLISYLAATGGLLLSLVGSFVTAYGINYIYNKNKVGGWLVAVMLLVAYTAQNVIVFNFHSNK